MTLPQVFILDVLQLKVAGEVEVNGQHGKHYKTLGKFLQVINQMTHKVEVWKKEILFVFLSSVLYRAMLVLS